MGHFAAVRIVSDGKPSLGTFPSNNRTSPRHITRRACGMAIKLRARKHACLSRAPHVLTPKASHWSRNLKDLKTSTHPTVGLTQWKPLGKLISAVPEGKQHVPGWPPALSPRCAAYLSFWVRQACYLEKESYCDRIAHSCVLRSTQKMTTFRKFEMVSQSK